MAARCEAPNFLFAVQECQIINRQVRRDMLKTKLFHFVSVAAHTFPRGKSLKLHQLINTEPFSGWRPIFIAQASQYETLCASKPQLQQP